MIFNFFSYKFKISFLIYLKKLFYFFEILINLKSKNKPKFKNKILIKDKINKENTLIFSPESIFTSHHEMSEELANKLKNISNIFIFECINNFTQCMHKINRNYWWSSNKKIRNMQENIGCQKCMFQTKIGRRDENLNYINNLDIEDILIEKEILKINNFNIEQIKNYKFKNINMYNLVLYDYFIVFKKDKLYKLEEEEIIFIKKQIINNITAISIVEKICAQFNIRNVFMIDEYSFQSSIRAWCKLNKIKVFFFQYAYSSKRVLEFTNVDSWPLRIEDYKYNWEIFKKLPVTAQMVRETYDNLLLRMQNKATHIFSKKYDKKKTLYLIKKLKIDKTKKIIGLFTSSDDEERAIAQNINFFKSEYNFNDLFHSQEDWIDKTIQFVENSNNFQLIIVIHPRLFKSLNSPRTSSNYKKLFNKYNSLKLTNTTIVWPEDNISTYNVIEQIDIATVSWSSIGLEISLLGIPVITGIERYVPITVNFEGIRKAYSLEEYYAFFKNENNYEIKNYLNRIKMSIRWFNLLTFGNSLHNYYCKDKVASIEYLLKDNNPININSGIKGDNLLIEKDEKIETDTILDNFLTLQNELNLKFKKSSLSEKINNFL